NTAARIVTGTKIGNHITPVLKSLHWLPVVEHIAFKTALLTFKVIHVLAPSYLCDLIRYCSISHNLRFINDVLLYIPKFIFFFGCVLTCKSWGDSLISLVRLLPRRWYTDIKSWGDSLISLVRQVFMRWYYSDFKSWGDSHISLVWHLSTRWYNLILNPGEEA